MIKTFLARLTKPKVLLVLVISALLLGVTVYLVPKKLDEHGICWAKGRALSSEELYQSAMQDFMQNLFDVNDAYRVRRGALGFKRRTVDIYYCDKRDCDVWSAPPITYKDILELKNKFRVDSTYLPYAPDAGRSYNEIPKAFSWQRISTLSEAGVFKQRNNSKTILTTEMFGGTIFYPADCCEIYTAAQWNALVQKYPISPVMDEHLPLNTRKYLIIKWIVSPEVSISYNGRSGRSFPLTKPVAQLYAINACGRTQGKKNTLELYLNLKE